jgi:hypothetical protein
MKMNTITVLFIFFSLTSFAENSSSKTVSAMLTAGDSSNISDSGLAIDSVDISQLVSAQIETARKKQTQDSIDILEAKNIPLKAVATSQAVITPKPKNEKPQWQALGAYVEQVLREVSTANEITIKLSIMGAATFFAFIIVYVRRKKINSKRETKANFKDGIKLIREERVKDRINIGLSLIRNKLIGSASSFLLSNDSVAKNARDLNIAKGEIYLAARIKSHELKKASY